MFTDKTIAERILYLIDYYQITVNEFSKRLGYTRSQFLYDIINSKSKPSFQFFEKLSVSEFGLNINFECLITGNGELLKSKSELASIAISNLNLNFQQLAITQKDIIELQKKEILKLENTITTFKDNFQNKLVSSL